MTKFCIPFKFTPHINYSYNMIRLYADASIRRTYAYILHLLLELANWRKIIRSFIKAGLFENVSYSLLVFIN